MAFALGAEGLPVVMMTHDELLAGRGAYTRLVAHYSRIAAE
jgi:hypothetical protein